MVAWWLYDHLSSRVLCGCCCWREMLRRRMYPSTIFNDVASFFSRTITSHSPKSRCSTLHCVSPKPIAAASPWLSSTMNLRSEPYVLHHLVCTIWLDATHYVFPMDREILAACLGEDILRGKSSRTDFYYAFKLDNFAINLFTLRLKRSAMLKKSERNVFNVMHGRRRFFPPNIISGISPRAKRFLNSSLSPVRRFAQFADKTPDVMGFAYK